MSLQDSSSNVSLKIDQEVLKFYRSAATYILGGRKATMEPHVGTLEEKYSDNTEFSDSILKAWSRSLTQPLMMDIYLADAGAGGSVSRHLIEQWTFTYARLDSPVRTAYQRKIMTLLRSLYVWIRLLPGFQVLRTLNKPANLQFRLYNPNNEAQAQFNSEPISYMFPQTNTSKGILSVGLRYVSSHLLSQMLSPNSGFAGMRPVSSLSPPANMPVAATRSEAIPIPGSMPEGNLAHILNSNTNNFNNSNNYNNNGNNGNQYNKGGTNNSLQQQRDSPGNNSPSLLQGLQGQPSSLPKSAGNSFGNKGQGITAPVGIAMTQAARRTSGVSTVSSISPGSCPPAFLLSDLFSNSPLTTTNFGGLNKHHGGGGNLHSNLSLGGGDDSYDQIAGPPSLSMLSTSPQLNTYMINQLQNQPNGKKPSPRGDERELELLVKLPMSPIDNWRTQDANAQALVLKTANNPNNASNAGRGDERGGGMLFQRLKDPSPRGSLDGVDDVFNNSSLSSSSSSSDSDNDDLGMEGMPAFAWGGSGGGGGQNVVVQMHSSTHTLAGLCAAPPQLNCFGTSKADQVGAILGLPPNLNQQITPLDLLSTELKSFKDFRSAIPTPLLG